MNVPLLDLRTPDDQPAPWAAIWQRHNLLLLIGEDDCDACRKVMSAWDAMGPLLQSENAVAVAILPSDPGAIPDGVIVLLDPEMRMAKVIGAAPGTVVAADRYFEIQHREDLHECGAQEVVRKTLAWIDLAERRCDECGIGTW